MLTQNRESGRILILVLIIVFTLSAFWFVALSSTGTELQLTGGRKSSTQRLFDAEAALNSVMENFGPVAPTLIGDLTTVTYTADVRDTSDPDPAKQPVIARITCRPIQDISPVAGLPLQEHEVTPPAGSGSGVNSTVAKRFGVNAVSVDGDREVQAGFYWVVTK